MKLAEYFGSDKKDWEAFGGGLFEPGGVYSVFIARIIASDKRLDSRLLLFSRALPLKIVLQKGLTVDFEKVSRSWLCLCKSQEQEKQQRCALS